MPTQSIKIKEILIQGKRGQTESAKPTLDKRPILHDTEIIDPDRVDNVVALIQSIASKTSLNHEPGEITRAITDEFSFYPKNTPFTLEEYKQIIARTADIAKTLPPDVHMVLATFPVIWPDGGIHNCGLYVESPQSLGAEPKLHHFSKKNHSVIDFSYARVDGSLYNLTTDSDCTPDQRPDVVLQGTAVTTNDVNQHGSALKISTSDGGAFISTIGICLDHQIGVERTDLHYLIDALDVKKEPIPLHCSHVITSASTAENEANVLSTISHADPSVSYRRPSKYPARLGFVEDNIHSPFSAQLTTEIYPPKLIGTLHSDIYQHICANQPIDKLAAELNEKDEHGNTALHRVFLETDFDHELMAKRLYSMILNGGDPNIRNSNGLSVIEVANQTAKDDPANKIVMAINAATAWKDRIIIQNSISAEDGHTPLTRLLAHGQPDLEALNKMILNGSNPYVKNKNGENAFDIVRKYEPLAIRAIIENELKTDLKLTQYGFHSASRSNHDSESSWFSMPENIEIEESIALPSKSTTYSPIQNAQKFNTILKFMSQQERTTVYEYMANQLPELIHSSVNEFLDIVQYLSNDQRSIVFEASKESLAALCGKSPYPASIVSDLLGSINTEQRSWIYEKIHDQLPHFIKSSRDFHDVLKHLNEEQRRSIYNKMKETIPTFIKSGKDVQETMKYLLPEQRSALLNSIKPQLTNVLFDIVLGTEKLSIDNMLENFSDEEQRTIKSYVQFLKDINSSAPHANLLHYLVITDTDKYLQETKVAFHSLIAHIQKTTIDTPNPTEELVAALSFSDTKTIKKLLTSLEKPLTDDQLSSRTNIKEALDTYILNIGKDSMSSYKASLASLKPSPDKDLPSATVNI